MSEWLWVAGMFMLGGLLAAAWLLGLWIEVQNLARRRRPGLRLVLGAVLRLSIVAAGFYLVITAGPDWLYLAAALLGFMVARFLILWAVRRHEGVDSSARRESA